MCGIIGYAGSGDAPQILIEALKRLEYRGYDSAGIAVQENGAFSVVLEGIPADLAERITETLEIPTIGIGAGPKCDGQIQVYHDILGLYGDMVPKHTKQYGNFGVEIQKKLSEYKNEVEVRKFPSPKHFTTSKVQPVETH